MGEASSDGDRQVNQRSDGGFCGNARDNRTVRAGAAYSLNTTGKEKPFKANPDAPAKIGWVPQPGPQQHFVECLLFDVMFGGARGGGKTDACIGDWLHHQNKYGAGARGLFFRRTLKELEAVIERTRELFPMVGAKFNEQKKQWRFPNGAVLGMAYLEREADAANYQGHSYCVGIGTKIRMADGTLRAIESIRVGESVATLEGPRRVQSVTEPYLAPCVLASVRGADGEFVGSQIHPVWHPVLTTAGLISSRTEESRHADGQFQNAKPDACTHPQGFDGDAGPKIPAWFAWSKDDQNAHKAQNGTRLETERFQVLTAHVVLHKPTFRSGPQLDDQDHREATEYRFQCKSTEPLLDSCPNQTVLSQGFLQRIEHGQSKPDFVDPCLTSAESCGRNDFLTGSSFPSGCRSDRDSHDGQSHVFPRTAQGYTPRLDGAETRLRLLPSDDLGTTQKHTLNHRRTWVHPYTGAERNLSESVEIGVVELSWHGPAMVADISVEGANHYISDCGLVNKNTRIYAEELTNWPTPRGLDRLMGTLRSARGVPVAFRSTANPGGPGHAWVKARYIDPAPLGYRILRTARNQTRMFVPSRLVDNKILMEADPDYESRLYLVGSEELVRAWLTGDWNVIEGAFFDCFRVDRHVMKPVELPTFWLRFRSFDVGSSAPFHVGWWCVVSETFRHPDGRIVPRGALIMYREWYGAKKQADTYTGIKLTSQQVADGIVSREAPDEKITYSVVDPAGFKEEGGPSYVEQMSQRQPKLVWGRADNTRVGELGSLSGWSLVRQRLLGDADGNPMIFFFSTCVDSIRTLPILQHDISRPEDIDSDMEDHAADSIRYACASRPWAAPLPERAKPIKGLQDMSLNDLWNKTETRHRRI